MLVVLHTTPDAPRDLRARAATLAGALLEMAGAAALGAGLALALYTLDSGQARDRFERICRAQGGLRTPPRAACVQAFDNRKLARLAKLAGTPERPVARLHLEIRPGDEVARGQPLFSLHAQTRGGGGGAGVCARLCAPGRRHRPDW
ncbi:hypothetical protein LTT95_00330 [Luteimonas sp. A1P009]|uniref:Pyrimidine nucleoside phosphorylase C-terminal domain-containing protein n=1 Tax=Luteimonas fraxinea TaxID=2901869 RepID=A0ABS8U8Y8_9GAMM|nr:hypothetical protein [Luteimonas fraxinea]